MEGRLFEDLVLSRVGPRRVHAGGMPFSFVLHAAGITSLLALSMVATEELPIPPVVRIPLSGPRAAGAVTAAPSVSTTRRMPSPRRDSVNRISVPTETRAVIEAEPFAPDPEGSGSCTGCIVGDDVAREGGGEDGSVGDRFGTTAASEPRGAPLRVGGHIQPPRKIRHVDPVYPELARRAGVAGVVILECVIDREGHLRSVAVLRGHPLLDQAAMDAVRQWTYRPTLLNGVPVEIVMTVTVRFATR